MLQIPAKGEAPQETTSRTKAKQIQNPFPTFILPQKTIKSTVGIIKSKDINMLWLMTMLGPFTSRGREKSTKSRQRELLAAVQHSGSCECEAALWQWWEWWKEASAERAREISGLVEWILDLWSLCFFWDHRFLVPLLALLNVLGSSACVFSWLFLNGWASHFANSLPELRRMSRSLRRFISSNFTDGQRNLDDARFLSLHWESLNGNLDHSPKCQFVFKT